MSTCLRTSRLVLLAHHGSERHIVAERRVQLGRDLEANDPVLRRWKRTDCIPSFGFAVACLQFDLAYNPQGDGVQHSDDSFDGDEGGVQILDNVEVLDAPRQWKRDRPRKATVRITMTR
eukprot:scaffold10488_cov67-Cyclotella_meneghiniana.AAC.14